MTAENQLELQLPVCNEIQEETISFSDLVDKSLATETILNLGYYFYCANKSKIEVEVLFPKAVHLIERDDYQLGKNALDKFKNALNRSNGDVDKINGDVIRLGYKLLAYEKGYRRGRTRGFMSLHIVEDKDPLLMIAAIKRTVNFFNKYPDGDFKVSIDKRKKANKNKTVIHYVQSNRIWEVISSNCDINDYDLKELKVKQGLYKKETKFALTNPSIGIFNPYTNEEYIIEQEVNFISRIFIFIYKLLFKPIALKRKRQ